MIRLGWLYGNISRYLKVLKETLFASALKSVFLSGTFILEGLVQIQVQADYSFLLLSRPVSYLCLPWTKYQSVRPLLLPT